METRIGFCVILDAVAVFSLISAGLSLAGASFLPADSMQLFGWLFMTALALFAVARVTEILRVLVKTPNAASMRVVRPATSTASAETLPAEAAKAEFPRAA
jgi:hypothetical protein